MLTRRLNHSRKRKVRAYRFRLADSRGWMTFISPVRNRAEAAQAIERTFGEKPVALCIHRLFDPWRWLEHADSAKGTTPVKRPA